MTGTNQHLIQEKIERRLNLGNGCYFSVQSLLSSHLLSENVEIRINKNILLCVILYGSESWSLKLREKHELRVFETRVLRRMFGSWRDKVTGGWRGLYNELYNL
jgi:hypothetical protein